MKDILFWEDDAVFSYRVGGLLQRDGRVLFQSAPGDEGLAIPGGHVAFGEENAAALAREFHEELGVTVEVGRLRAVGEIFFPWRKRPCHQICLYYDVRVVAGEVPAAPFDSVDGMDGYNAHVRFHWVPLASLPGAVVYPPQIVPVLLDPDAPISHFVYHQA